MTVVDISEKLTGSTVASLKLPTTSGTDIDLASLKGTTVVYAYPRTSPPDQPPIEGWDQIPGARGCTPQSKEFSAHYDEIIAAGADRVFGLSTQDTAYQAEMKNRLGLPFDVLSDDKLALANNLRLPTFDAGGMTLLTRITLIIRDGSIDRVFFPVTDPAGNAKDVLEYLLG